MELKARCKERFEPVVQAIIQLQKDKEGLDEPLIVAIDGRCGSGKTTLGEYLEQVFDCNLFRMDDFFLRMEQRTPQRLKETGGNVDYERFEETVLRPIFQKQPVFYQPFKDQMENIKKRNGPEKAKQFQNMWIPKEEAYFKKFHVMDGAIQVMWNLKTEK